MLCQNCNERNATVHLTRIINGEKTEVYLCEQCAREKGELNFVSEPFSLHNFLAGIFSPDFHPGRNVVQESQHHCGTCSMSFNEFGKSGRFGCSECYDAFEPRLSQMLRRIHGSDQHTGKVPERTGQFIKQKNELKELRNQLQLAIAREEFEKAAELRDEIYKLEKRNRKEHGGEEQ